MTHHDQGHAGDRIDARDRTRAERDAERAATIGGFTGAVLGARGGPIGAGIGAFLGGSTGYVAGYALSELQGRRRDPRETTLDEYSTGDRPTERDAPVRIEVGDEEESDGDEDGDSDDHRSEE